MLGVVSFFADPSLKFTVTIFRKNWYINHASHFGNECSNAV
jgi:hypothetical protein